MSKSERKSIKSGSSDENQMNKIIQFDKKTDPGSRQYFVKEINHDEILTEEIVGKGAFGVVWKGTWRELDVAVKYFFSKFLFRDIKSPNLLLTCDGNTLKICDFGIACCLRTIMTNNVGSAPWMAPEVFQGTSYTEKCDVYSWGLLLWEIFSRSIPYKDIYKEPYQILWAVCHGTRPSLIPDCPSKIQELYTQCWSKSPNERPSMNEVVKIMTDLFTSFSGIHHEDALCQINGAPVIPADLAEHQRQSVCQNSKKDTHLQTETQETNYQKSNVHQNDNFSNTNNQKLSGSSHRLYDPLQYSANSNNAAVKRLDDENEPNKMNKDNMSWKIKYLQGLKLCAELQDQIDNQAAEIFHLKQELEKFRGNK
ncbi:hypothetical protein PV328_010885 [Microctonus aethiopoides]|uniref:Protein kinase domain-containing protein n=1 Tax=Microctonus aethiopoides TaxID=144406 RepID=A0AA39KQT0_9HYME|nr:hypothetical protein PV328_010885 [Microctonus aethiopoides]